MRPSRKTYPAIPITRNAAAAPNAQEKECVAWRIYPVMIGAAMPAIWFARFRIPPSVPTLSRGAIKDGIDQPTGEAADNPPIDMLIQKTAANGVTDCVAPKIPIP